MTTQQYYYIFRSLFFLLTCFLLLTDQPVFVQALFATGTLNLLAPKGF